MLVSPLLGTAAPTVSNSIYPLQQITNAITVHAGQALLPTKKIAAIQEKLQKHPKPCLFREPQFDAPIISKLAAENKTVVVDELDPVGYQKKDIGYPAILLNIANKLVNCSQRLK